MTCLEINLKKLEHNYFSLRNRLQPQTKMIGVVKANAYGSLSVPVAQKLVDLGMESLAVAYAPEGKKLRQSGIEIPILVFYPQTENFEEIIRNNLEPVLYSKRSWDGFVKAVTVSKKMNYPVHIKYNTGLNRIGFGPDEIDWVLKNIETGPFEVKTIYSHLGQTESLKPDRFTDNQISTFEAIMEKHNAAATHKPEYHLLNTSGVFNYPDYHMDWVRVGLGLYGFANHPQWNDNLAPIAELKTNITQIHEIMKGETVGYNCGWSAPENTRIAVLPLGHADGLSRQNGHGKGAVMVHGKKAPIVGNVCMDMVMVDIGVIQCKEGDEVVIFGNGSRVDDLAENTGTISYELLAALSDRIPRVIKK
ncbi:MAG: alanine racemase [Flavobacteriaceae bacterium]|nr:alanine racemase [Flavobacteriaceae bacterium]